jgi:hypothetical protein
MFITYLMLFLMFVATPLFVLGMILFRGDVMLRNIGKAGDTFAHALHCHGPEYGHCDSSHCNYPPFPRDE